MTVARAERPSRVHAYHKLSGAMIEDIRPALRGPEPRRPIGQEDDGPSPFTDDFALSRLILCPGLLPKTCRRNRRAARSQGLTEATCRADGEKAPPAERLGSGGKGRNERGTPVGFESVTFKGLPTHTRRYAAGRLRVIASRSKSSSTSLWAHVVKNESSTTAPARRADGDRSAVGPVALGDLAAFGAARALTADEVSALWTAVGGRSWGAGGALACVVALLRAIRRRRALRAFFGAELSTGPGARTAFPGLRAPHDDAAEPTPPPPKRARLTAGEPSAPTGRTVGRGWSMSRRRCVLVAETPLGRHSSLQHTRYAPT